MQGPQPADIFEGKGQNDCNLSYVTNMFLKKNFRGAITKFPLPGFGPARRQQAYVNY